VASPETTLTAFRLAAWDTPLWVNPNRREGRYNNEGVGPTQYMCLHPLGPWAELLRGEDRRQPGEVREFRMRLWVLRVRVANIADLTFDTAEDYDVRAGDLVSDDYGACQEFADRHRADPKLPDILRVPSAALPGTRNLVILGPRVGAPYLAEPVSDIDIPTSVAAERGQALHALPQLIRYRGEPHAEFEAWQRGETLAFVEPPTPLP